MYVGFSPVVTLNFLRKKNRQKTWDNCSTWKCN